jgi:hypothetical protein
MRAARIAAFGADSGGFRAGGFRSDHRHRQTGSRRIRNQGIHRREGREGVRISRRAVHWGFPKTEREDAGEKQNEGTAAEEEEEEGPLRQSHDFEFSYGLTDRWLFSTTLTADEPLDEDFALSSVELELQYELIEIKENKGLGLAFFGGYGFATRGGDADEIEFGPIVELGTGNLLLTFNPIFGAQVGENRETDGLGFEYGWRAEYDFAKHWGIGVEVFGEIEDLANAGSFDDQNHSIGPTLFWNPGSEEEEAKGRDEDEDNNKVPGPPTWSSPSTSAFNSA